MLLLQPATRHRPSQSRVGIAIAGGGPIGGMYELGVLRALDEAIDGLDLTALDVYVGVGDADAALLHVHHEDMGVGGADVVLQDQAFAAAGGLAPGPAADDARRRQSGRPAAFCRAARV